MPDALHDIPVTSGPLIDSFGRVHTNLRISVTDRCNIRCFYCMPAENVEFMDRAELLTFEEIERIVRVAVPLGLREIRLTGGEPLVRKNLHVLVRKLAAIEGIDERLLLASESLEIRRSLCRKVLGASPIDHCASEAYYHAVATVSAARSA
jgi:uncharacterized radical SAM superfamily Fe-S cluster-containing enzyme